MKCNVEYGPILHFKKVCFLSGKMSVGAMLGQPLSQNRVIFVR